MKEDGMHINEFGTKWWWLNGKLHREDGPAIEYADGSKTWRLNGQLHRLDGPAREDTDGDKAWYLNGTYYYSFDEWLEKLDAPVEDKLFLKLKWD